MEDGVLIRGPSHSAIRISREGRHVLLNFCVHTALTFSVFAGGINHTKYPGLCQAVSPAPHGPRDLSGHGESQVTHQVPTGLCLVSQQMPVACSS